MMMMGGTITKGIFFFGFKEWHFLVPFVATAVVVVVGGETDSLLINRVIITQ